MILGGRHQPLFSCRDFQTLQLVHGLRYTTRQREQSEQHQSEQEYRSSSKYITRPRENNQKSWKDFSHGQTKKGSATHPHPYKLINRKLLSNLIFHIHPDLMIYQ